MPRGWRGLESAAYLSAVRSKGGEVLLEPLVVPRQDAGRMGRTTVRGDVFLSSSSYLFCVMTLDFQGKKKTVNRKNGVDCKETAVFFFFSFLYPNMFVEPLNN